MISLNVLTLVYWVSLLIFVVTTLLCLVWRQAPSALVSGQSPVQNGEIRLSWAVLDYSVLCLHVFANVFLYFRMILNIFAHIRSCQSPDEENPEVPELWKNLAVAHGFIMCIALVYSMTFYCMSDYLKLFDTSSVPFRILFNIGRTCSIWSVSVFCTAMVVRAGAGKIWFKAPNKNVAVPLMCENSNA
jgi:hypothetical protein